MKTPDKNRFAASFEKLDTVKVSRAAPPIEAINRSTDVTYRVKTPAAVTKAFKLRSSAPKA